MTFSRRQFLESAAMASLAASTGHAAEPGKLPTRLLGKTGVRVSVLGIGGGSRFLAYKDEDKALEALNAALDQGIRYVDTAQSYGKAGIVGLLGEQEHANALLTTAFAEPLRQALGGGKAWISSYTKRAAPGTTIDVPLASKDALYVRSHYDGMSVNLPDAPMPDEIAVIFCVANRGRINARVGGLKLSDAKGQDGLT